MFIRTMNKRIRAVAKENNVKKIELQQHHTKSDYTHGSKQHIFRVLAGPTKHIRYTQLCLHVSQKRKQKTFHHSHRGRVYGRHGAKVLCTLRLP